MTILLALSQLDTTNDEHWTDAGLPLVDVVSELAGINLSRADITEVAPEFTRDNNALTDEQIALLEQTSVDDEVEIPTEDSEEVVDAVQEKTERLRENILNIKGNILTQQEKLKTQIDKLDAHLVKTAEEQVHLSDMIKQFQKSQLAQRAALLNKKS